MSAIFLSPFGSRDTAKLAVLLSADNGVSFTVAELLRKAKAIQDPQIGAVRLTEDAGIYRDGIKKSIPSYYIWGSRSRPMRLLSISPTRQPRSPGKHDLGAGRHTSWFASRTLMMCIRFERSAQTHVALLSLACCVICVRALSAF